MSHSPAISETTESPELALLRAMRVRRDETQLTRALAVLMNRDPALRRAVAREILECAVASGNQHAPKALRSLPAVLQLGKEVPLGALRGRGSRVRGGILDWEFRHADFRLAVEAKIGAQAEKTQLLRYLNELATLKAGGLVLITHKLEQVRGVERNRHWLGQIRWASLLPRIKQIVPVEPGLAVQWQMLLRVVEDDLSAGPVSALSDANPGERNQLLLESVRDDVIEKIKRGLPMHTKARPDGRSGAQSRKGRKTVFRSGDLAYMDIFMPAQKGTHVIRFEVSGSQPPLTVVTRVFGNRQWGVQSRASHKQARDALTSADFSAGDDGWLEAADMVTHEPRSGEALQRAVWQAIDTRLTAIIDSGALAPFDY